jgi:hypothetical protein
VSERSVAEVDSQNTIQKIQECDKKFQSEQIAANAFPVRVRGNLLLEGEVRLHTGDRSGDDDLP